jgi:hypothetical protein
VDDDLEGSNGGVFEDPEFLNSLSEPGIPPHELALKVGAICRLTRNFDASRGLTKNTRVIVRNLLRHTVEIETIPCIVAAKVVNAVFEPSTSVLHLIETIHRYDSIYPGLHNVHFQPHGFNFIVQRKQIPLALCYATTFNGCQGLTVQKLGLDLRRPVFSHGQLYSAMTRVPDSHNVLILKYEGDSSTSTTNIVCQEELLL